MTLVRTVTLALLFGGALAAGTALGAWNPPDKPDVKNLMATPLADEFTPGREVLIDLVQIPPNTALDRHWHPGEEFHYYLEGEVEIKIDGEPSIIGKPGTVGHVPFKKRHRAVAGKSGAKILVFRVHTKGQPWRYVENESGARSYRPCEGVGIPVAIPAAPLTCIVGRSRALIGAAVGKN